MKGVSCAFVLSFIFLCETHCQYSSVDAFWRKVGYDLIYESTARGHNEDTWKKHLDEVVLKLADMKKAAFEFYTTVFGRIKKNMVFVGRGMSVASIPQLLGMPDCYLKGNKRELLGIGV
ncbi:hypothetical protein RJT34_31067 [Clitoria ternatea]|uniref:Cyclotide n=1 Tax=Clitoria ternatea TaxID=43366 RepID=A0AAN9EVT0_CLITE